MKPRASLLRLVDATNALLAAAECGDLPGCERFMRERDAAIAALVTETARSRVRDDERELLARVTRAAAQVETKLAAQLESLRGELRSTRERRSALPPRPTGSARSLGRV